MRLLLIEDEECFLRQILSEVSETYLVDVAYNGEEGAYMSEINDYDVIIVDSTLPDISGKDVCKKTRDADVKTPMMFLADASIGESEKLLSLDAGADIYISKPLNSKEFQSKLGALIRRATYSYTPNTICVGSLEINTKYREVRFRGNLVNLRRREYDILEYLAFNKGRIVTKEKLLEHIWRDGIFVMSNTVEVHIKSIRDKIDRVFGTNYLHTIRGFGYKLSEG